MILKSPKTTYQVGDSFQVSLILDTGGLQINTLSGIIDIPTDKFQISDLRYGNSFITLWVDRPKIDYSKGIITFTGGVPGGFGGSSGPVLSFGLKARRVGEGTLTPMDVKILLNDGQGTELKNITFKTLTLNVVPRAEEPVKPAAPAKPEAEPAVEVYQPPADTAPPEGFIPIVSRHPSIGDNRYFISFSAVDKDSGIDHYEVRERPFLLNIFGEKFGSSWTRAESPFILRGQIWRHQVLVRAFDQAGNATDAGAVKPFHSVVIVAAAVLATIVAGFAASRLRRSQHPPRKVVRLK